MCIFPPFFISTDKALKLQELKYFNVNWHAEIFWDSSRLHLEKNVSFFYLEKDRLTNARGAKSIIGYTFINAKQDTRWIFQIYITKIPLYVYYYSLNWISHEKFISLKREKKEFFWIFISCILFGHFLTSKLFTLKHVYFGLLELW